MSLKPIELYRRGFASVRRGRAYREVVGRWKEPVLLACSGGIDSMALLATAAIARDAGRVGAFIVVHVDHGARTGSTKEGRFVADIARELRCPVVQLRPARRSRRSGEGPEASLRSLRYGAIAGLAGSLGIRRVLTAHTLNDQVETILLRLFTGSSSVANAGMRDLQIITTDQGQIEIQRPMLGARRSDLESVLQALNLGHIEDPTNAELEFRRNRLRHRVIPALEELDPGYDKALLRAVAHARADGEVVDRIAGRVATDVIEAVEGGCTIERGFILEADLAVASRVVRIAIKNLIGGEHRELTHERVMAVIEAARRGEPATIQIPYGISVTVDGSRIQIGRPSLDAGER